MRAVITGGAGFIGSHLADALVARGDQVLVFDNLSTGRRENLRQLDGNANFTFREGTILDAGAVRECIDGSDVVFHLAAAVGVKRVIDHPLDALVTNVRGSEIVIDAAMTCGSRLVLASTSEVYGKNTSDSLREDDDRIMGPTQVSRWGYASSKTVDEFLALAYHRERGLAAVIARLFNTVGPRQVGDYGMVIPRFVTAALAGAPLQVYGDGTQRRCFAYVGDVVTGLIAMAETPEAVGEIFNLGNTEEISMYALAEKIVALTGSASPIERIPYSAAYEAGFQDMPRRVPDLGKARRLLGYEPQVGLEALLGLIIEDCR